MNKLSGFLLLALGVPLLCSATPTKKAAQLMASLQCMAGKVDKISWRLNALRRFYMSGLFTGESWVDKVAALRNDRVRELKERYESLLKNPSDIKSQESLWLELEKDAEQEREEYLDFLERLEGEGEYHYRTGCAGTGTVIRGELRPECECGYQKLLLDQPACTGPTLKGAWNMSHEEWVAMQEKTVQTWWAGKTVGCRHVPKNNRVGDL
jgi:hypothetical protein